jgi:hypothetical protein
VIERGEVGDVPEAEVGEGDEVGHQGLLPA